MALAWHAGGMCNLYTMLMQPANHGDDMRPFHNRQPVFLDRDSARLWLDLSADYRPILCAPQKGRLSFDPPEPVSA